MKGVVSMEDNLYIVTCTDTETNEPAEYECTSLTHAKEIYGSLKNATDIINLNILQYNLVEQRYHMVDTTEL